jgi:phosphatidylglycerophosphatase A
VNNFKIAKIIATFFGSGLSPKAPGTMGTIAAIPLVVALNHLGPFWIMGFVILFLPVAVWACSVYQKNVGTEDPQAVVIDEVIGFAITMTWLPATWQAYVLGFILFRLLEITKPGPIGVLDKRVKGGLGIMLDDIAAGIIANIILQVIYNKTSWLGAQLVTS